MSDMENAHADWTAADVMLDPIGAAARIAALEKALAQISLAEGDTTTSAADKVRDMARIARSALRTGGGGKQAEARAEALATLLHDFREHVIRYAKVWDMEGGSHHHPIWLRIAEALRTGGGE